MNSTAVVHGAKGVGFAAYLPQLMQLLLKIERWWVINVEMATDPDINMDEIDEAGIIPGSYLMLQVLSQVALGNEEEAWYFHRETKKRRSAEP
jgi:hypothetical protein